VSCWFFFFFNKIKYYLAVICGLVAGESPFPKVLCCIWPKDLTFIGVENEAFFLHSSSQVGVFHLSVKVGLFYFEILQISF
jgi:hypothetical protein